MSKKQLRDRRHLKQRLKKHGLEGCALCGPVQLFSPADDTSINMARGLCPNCGRGVQFRLRPEEPLDDPAFDMFLDRLLASGSYCRQGFRIVMDGEVVEEKLDCGDGCALSHVELRFNKPGEGSGSATG